MLSLAIAVLIPLVLGDFLVRVFWPPLPEREGQAFLRSALAVAVGFGTSAGLYFFWQVRLPGPGLGFLFTELMIAILLFARVLLRLASPEEPTSPRQAFGSGRSLGFAFWVVAAIAAAAIWLFISESPHGGDQAWTIWNLKARFVFSAAEWREALRHLPEWAHPEAPPLLPALVARCWTTAGRESVGIPAVLAGLFAAATAMLVVGGVARFRGIRTGFLAGVALAGASSFLFSTASLEADVPFSLYALAAVVLAAMSDEESRAVPAFLFLGGLSAALAAFTKNEGLTFLGAFLAVRAAAEVRRGVTGVRSLLWTLGGALPVVGLLSMHHADFPFIGYRIAVSPAYPDDAAFAGWTTLAVASLSFLYFGVSADRQAVRRASFAAGAVVCLLTAGLLAARGIQPARLIVQFWPAVVFVLFSATRLPDRQTGAAPAA